MKKETSLLLLLLAACGLCIAPVFGQTNFREGYQKADPVTSASTLSFEEKVDMHQRFLDKATHDNDTLSRLYGFLFLFKDHLQAENYPEATRCLLEAETLAKASGKPGWQGGVCYRKGILSVYLKTYKEAIAQYEAAVLLCGQAHDSLCIAESLEQISSMCGRIGDYPRAHRYFNLAMPLLERFGGDAQIGTALTNFGNLLALQERPAEAISYFERALAINEKVGDPRRTAQFLSNLADSYCQLGRYQQAFEAYHRCIDTNRRHNWSENLLFNYRGISVVYEETGDFRSALDFFKQFHNLHDSIIGAETQEKIAELQIKYESQQKELTLQKSQVALNAAQRLLERQTLFIFFALLLVALGLWRWRWQVRHAKQKHIQNEKALSDLTRILVDKNTRLATLEAQMAASPSQNDPPTTHGGFEENLYKQHILTEADWTAFKIYFEKVHPGYLSRLRTTYPDLSEAETRLFLFIKLNLNRKETAAILGIAVDSIKKTRSRLRKRLLLEHDTDLDGHVHAF